MFEREREELVERLSRWGYLTKPEIVKAFKKVPRHEFVPPNVRDYSYADQPLPIGHGQTISAPSMIAIMMESLDLAPMQRVLEIGAGSGYNAALIAEVVGKEGEIVTIERIAELAEFAEENLKRTGYGWVKVTVGDGTCGYKKGAPWDRILVTACAPELPKPLVEQLKVGGKLGAPVGQHYMFQTWVVAEKRGEKELKIQERGGCSFVPLIGKCGWKEEG
ncbi:MAG: protein-L-isoaspartate(D-aspartate) O-methyltransferase [Candidatus Hodarchaeaceae archaeon]|nr:protein-L-isoaspartate(D-aspartate) O-methyltransferase [Candidatus Hodarchaeaceae archaeon]